MLVFTRKAGQKIVVPECDLVVEVLAVRGTRVRVGIKAPRDLAVHRAELLDRSRKEPAGSGRRPR